jgi:hypothetical protein
VCRFRVATSWRRANKNRKRRPCWSVTKIARITFLSLAFSYWTDKPWFLTGGKLLLCSSYLRLGFPTGRWSIYPPAPSACDARPHHSAQHIVRLIMVVQDLQEHHGLPRPCHGKDPSNAGLRAPLRLGPTIWLCVFIHCLRLSMHKILQQPRDGYIVVADVEGPLTTRSSIFATIWGSLSIIDISCEYHGLVGGGSKARGSPRSCWVRPLGARGDKD